MSLLLFLSCLIRLFVLDCGSAIGPFSDHVLGDVQWRSTVGSVEILPSLLIALAMQAVNICQFR
jgi:hypothetical protein